MTRTPLVLHAQDISAFARALGGQLSRHEGPPSHLELLNMLARSSGFRNFQHLRAACLPAACPPAAAAAPVSAPDKAESNRLRRLSRLFDAQGRLVRWPSRRGLEADCLWAVWSGVEPRRVYSEPELKDALNALHTFGDHALLRRGLCDLGLMTRTPDGREYRRVEARPGESALALLALLRPRRA
jgi:hypothetical protein